MLPASNGPVRSPTGWLYYGLYLGLGSDVDEATSAGALKLAGLALGVGCKYIGQQSLNPEVPLQRRFILLIVERGLSGRPHLIDAQ